MKRGPAAVNPEVQSQTKTDSTIGMRIASFVYVGGRRHRNLDSTAAVYEIFAPG